MIFIKQFKNKFNLNFEFKRVLRQSKQFIYKWVRELC